MTSDTRSEYVLVPKAALDWLNGEGPDTEGHWFGDGSFPRKGAFWWRGPFRAMLAAAPTPPKVGSGELDAAGLKALRAANVERQALWCPEQIPDLSFRGCELAGEVGEVCNVIKKLERERFGWIGSRDTVEHLAEELADVVICADLVAISAGIDLDAAVIAKFNATSEKVGLPTRLAAPVDHPEVVGVKALKLVVAREQSILADLRSAHHGRGPGASSEMRSDDRDDYAAAEAMFAAARVALSVPAKEDGTL